MNRTMRPGFTLVEVALAVAVGLIIIGGTVLGYNAVKDNAANANARERVLQGVTVIEEYGSVNGGRYPVGGNDDFNRMWRRKHPGDYNTSPWGGSTGTPGGVTEGHEAIAGGSDASTAVAVGTVTGVGTPGTAVVGLAGNMGYVDGAGWWAVPAYSTASTATVKNYMVGIFDKDGQPWWDVRGGK